MNNVNSNSYTSPFRLIFLVCLAAAGRLLLAGGPTFVGSGGLPFMWDPTVGVPYAIDQGPLGSLNNEDAEQLVRDAFEAWKGVETATLTFSEQEPLSTDLNGQNYRSFMGSQLHPENPIIFDSDGSIIADRLGVEAKDVVLGFAGIRFADTQTQRFQSGWVVLNGTRANHSAFKVVVVHEVGHLLGLDHTQAGRPFAEDGNLLNNNSVPVMYPVAQVGGSTQPLRDDQVWFSWLYPEPIFRPSTGTIKGQVFRRTGGAFQGANVVAVPIDSSLIEQRREMVSVVSDFLITNDGSYELPGLTPGDYYVYIEPLDSDFTRGSGVGPYDARFSNFIKDYYNAANESGTDSDNPNEKTVIRVAAGQTVSGINLVSNENINDLDALTDDDEMTFEFPAGFSFPFYGKAYREVVVNSDGNLTFTGGDSQPGAARSRERFLTGLPRIAPLFTDLDPGSRGDDKKVTATAGTGELTFAWENVPEFTDSGETRPGNRFSVTLYANGDIRFKYESIQVTPDLDNLQVIVGISPGKASVNSVATDFSTRSLPIRYRSAPVFEAFEGSSFDLSGKEILFKTADSLATIADLFFPFYQGNSQNFTGYAVTNHAPVDAELLFQAFGRQGEPLPFADNPHIETLGPQKQLARLGSELFGTSLATLQNGWVKVGSTRPEMASFFQFGNGLTGSLTKMDGSVAIRAASKVLFFTRIYQGPASFPSLSGPRDATTLLSIANPSTTESITLLLKIVNAAGQPLAAEVSRTLAAQGQLIESVGSLFGLPGSVSGGMIRVDVTGGVGAVGFQLVELEDTVLGLNASPAGTANLAYSAQLANGTAEGLSIFTNIKLVNTAGVPRSVTLRAFREDGSVIGVFGPSGLVLNPNQSFERDVADVFGLGPTTSPAITGSIVVEADGPGIIGDVIFGDPRRIDFAAAMPLQSVLFKRAIFSQVSNGSLDPSRPSLNTFTGLAFFNPNAAAAEVTIQVFRSDGTLVGSKSLSLGPNRRLSETVQQLIPASAGLLRGYIVIESTQPLVAQELFGNVTLQFLSAVPPSVVQ
ncbi:MAG: matrixin family metalloprotease [Acidobacteria bacterium]|nr:matrixin family metalloprotease [Acidobacteriota bacterium]